MMISFCLIFSFDRGSLFDTRFIAMTILLPSLVLRILEAIVDISISSALCKPCGISERAARTF